MCYDIEKDKENPLMNNFRKWIEKKTGVVWIFTK